MVKRPENVQAIKEARALGDLSENAEYDAARNEQAELEGRIQQLEKLLENVENGLVFSKDGDKIWQCRNCGHIVIGKEAPEVCPVCSHPKAYFEVKAENY